jgi:Tetratricopeptide repeat.
MFVRLCLVVFVMTLFSGCTALNTIHYRKYYQEGLEAQRKGEYEMAKKYFYRAWDNAKIGRLEPQLRAESAYSLGRVYGILCDHKNAELLLLEALKYDKESSGPVYMSLFELAYLKYDQDKYDEAVSYFQQAIQLVDDQKYIEYDPATFVMHFSTYSKSLEKTGHNDEAKMFNNRAKVISEKYTNERPKAQRTLYNKNCNKTNSLDSKPKQPNTQGDG